MVCGMLYLPTLLYLCSFDEYCHAECEGVLIGQVSWTPECCMESHVWRPDRLAATNCTQIKAEDAWPRPLHGHCSQQVRSHNQCLASVFGGRAARRFRGIFCTYGQQNKHPWGVSDWCFSMFSKCQCGMGSGQ